MTDEQASEAGKVAVTGSGRGCRTGCLILLAAPLVPLSTGSDLVGSVARAVLALAVLFLHLRWRHGKPVFATGSGEWRAIIVYWALALFLVILAVQAIHSSLEKADLLPGSRREPSLPS